LQITDLWSANLRQGAPTARLWFDLLFKITGVKIVKIKFWVNQGYTNQNCCTQTLVILHTQTC